MTVNYVPILPSNVYPILNSYHVKIISITELQTIPVNLVYIHVKIVNPILTVRPVDLNRKKEKGPKHAFVNMENSIRKIFLIYFVQLVLLPAKIAKMKLTVSLASQDLPLKEQFANLVNIPV